MEKVRNKRINFSVSSKGAGFEGVKFICPAIQEVLEKELLKERDVQKFELVTQNLKVK